MAVRGTFGTGRLRPAGDHEPTTASSNRHRTWGAGNSRAAFQDAVATAREAAAAVT